jgi:hypothetical protein
MRKAIILLAMVISFSCNKEKNTGSISVSFDFSFSTERKPVAVAVDKLNRIIYVANENNSKYDYSLKIQKFNSSGELLETAVDFVTFNQGKYPMYIPGDICFDGNNNLNVFARPRDTLKSYNGFCILQFNTDDNLLKEYDFTESESYWYQSTLTCSDNYLIVTNGHIIKEISLSNNSVGDIPIQSDEIPHSSSHFVVSDIAINADGLIYLAGSALEMIDSSLFDGSGCQISKLDPQTNRITTFYSKARTGSMAANPNSPGIAISNLGYVCLATFYGKSLEVYDRNDELILQSDIRLIAGEKTLPKDIALDGDRIYIIDHSYNQVLVFKYKEYY